MVQRVVIVGGGSAGFMAALAIRAKLRDAVDVVVIRSKDIGVIGVGEGSTPALTRFLHEYVGVIPKKFFDTAQPTWKLGLRFLWGPRPHFNYSFSQGQLAARADGLPRMKAAYCFAGEMAHEDPLSALMTHDRAFERGARGEPLFHPNVAYHFENEKFVRFLEGYAAALGVTTLDDTVTDVERSENGVAALRLASGRREAADLFVDASGFVSLLLGKALGTPFVGYEKSLFCDRAVVGGWDRQDSPDAADQVIKPYTTCETMDAGWCWQIEHEGRINRGYVYSSGFVADEAAEAEFRAKNPKVGPTRIVRFVSGRYRDLWVGNVVAIGNAGGFVEPLEATALGAIAFQSRTLVDALLECDRDPTAAVRRNYNRMHAAVWDDVRDFLAVHYKFNTRVDTRFWRHCREHTDLAGASGVVEAYRETGPSMWLESAVPRESVFGVPGYLAMLVGQQVPHAGAGRPTEPERRTWEAQRQRYRAMAARGLTVRETLAAIRSPKWKWG
jgi:tryptophan halogenase